MTVLHMDEGAAAMRVCVEGHRVRLSFDGYDCRLSPAGAARLASSMDRVAEALRRGSVRARRNLADDLRDIAEIIEEEEETE
jgi:hypothetical protein